MGLRIQKFRVEGLGFRNVWGLSLGFTVLSSGSSESSVAITYRDIRLIVEIIRLIGVSAVSRGSAGRCRLRFDKEYLRSKAIIGLLIRNLN